MLHPYKLYEEDKTIGSMDYISATLEICTLYNGVPHGIAVIAYKDTEDEYASFRGVAVFNQGQLHNTSFTFVTEDGCRY